MAKSYINPGPIEFMATIQSDRRALPLDVWQELAFSHRREYVLWVEGAKRPETRMRRIASEVEMTEKKRKKSS